MLATQAAPRLYEARTYGNWTRRFSTSDSYGPADTWSYTRRVTPGMYFHDMACLPPKVDTTYAETEHRFNWCYTCERYMCVTSEQPWSRSITGWICPPCAAIVQGVYERVAPTGDDTVWTTIATQLVTHNRNLKSF